jgi:hypothetical protein
MSRSGGEIARDDGPLHIAAQAALGVVCGTVVVLLDGLYSLALLAPPIRANTEGKSFISVLCRK